MVKAFWGVLCVTGMALAVAGCGNGSSGTAQPQQGQATQSPAPQQAPAPQQPAAPPTQPMVCTGQNHTCLMQGSGQVFCSGSNLDGELADGTAMERHTWVPVVGLADSAELACGYSHTCARRAGGQVACWGRSYGGELGNGSTEPTQRPVEVTGLTGVAEISAGQGFTCARLQTGAVMCWGEGDNGQLGNGASNDSPTPVAVAGLADAVEIDAGRAHVCARKADGSVVCWGQGSSRQLGQGENTSSSNVPVQVQGLAGVTAVGAGGNHSCAATATGVLCWGYNNDGVLGNGLEGSGQQSGTPVAAGSLTGVLALALGTQRSCALLGDGTVSCWGYNNYTARLLGVGSEARVVTTPTLVQNLTEAVQLDVLDTHACAVRRGGQLSCWGSGSSGRLGNGQTNYTGGTAIDVVPAIATMSFPASTPDQFPPDPTAPIQVTPHISVGSHHVCGVMSDGRVFCFGEGSGGRLGNGSTASLSSDASRYVAGIADGVQVSAGLERTCVVRANGQVACWGSLTGGISSSLPVPVPGIADAVEVRAGGTAGGILGCVRHRSGTVSCWGEGNSGQLGNGGRDSSPTPVQVAGIADAQEIAVGINSACARLASGGVRCWGSSSYGELGNGGTDSSPTPVEVSGLRNVTALTGGGYNFCALARGNLSCWGSNEDGQIGNGQSGRENNATAPVEVRGLRNVARLGDSDDVICVVLADGEGRCWGANDFGQTGHNDTETDDVTSPWEVLRTQDPATAAFGAYAQLGCGWNFCCGLHVDGHVSCAGSTPIGGSGGFLGMSNRRSPFPIAAPGVQFPATTAAAQ